MAQTRDSEIVPCLWDQIGTFSDWLGWGFGARGRIRTCGLRLRRPSLYPAELHAQAFMVTADRELPILVRSSGAIDSHGSAAR